MEDVSGGCVQRKDPLSWYPPNEVTNSNSNVENGLGKLSLESPLICTDPNEHDDLDTWPCTGGHKLSVDMFQSLGAGYLLGDVRQRLAERIFGK